MSTILKHLTAGLPQLNLDGKTKTPEVAFGKAEQEHVVVFREGELLQVPIIHTQRSISLVFRFLSSFFFPVYHM